MPTNSDAKTTFDVDVAVLGAGIGGLALANALRTAGIDAHVFERAPELKEVGGAIVIREPSVKLFTSWKILGSFYSEAVKVDILDVRDSHGKPQGTRSTDLAGDGAAYSIHRTDVLKLLSDGVAPDHIHLGMECTNASDGNDRAVLKFANGSTCRAKVLVGADGIKSIVRKLVSDDEPIFEKVVVLRGIAPATALPQGVPNTASMRGETNRA